MGNTKPSLRGFVISPPCLQRGEIGRAFITQLSTVLIVIMFLIVRNNKPHNLLVANEEEAEKQDK